MKIGVLTIYGNNNYGNRLQSYALNTVLENYGYEVESIVAESVKKCWMPITKKMLVFLLGNRYYQGTNRKYIEMMRKIKFEKFTKKYIKTRWYFGKSRRFNEKLSFRYDYVIVGSDQVWNPHFWGEDEIENCTFNYFLKFIPNDRRIAYAASFGVDFIPEKHKKIFYNGLKNFSAISVREKNGISIIMDLIGVKVMDVLDPTLLLPKCEWEKIEKKSIVRSKKKYIFIYFLGEYSEQVRRSVKRLTDQYGLEVINIMDQNHRILYESGPSEFLDLIHHAEMVVTDSFHAVVFSIIYKIPFFVFERIQSGYPNMSARIESLLEDFKMQDRYCRVGTELTDPFKCDFSSVDKILFNKKKKSEDFLIKALKKRKY